MKDRNLSKYESISKNISTLNNDNREGIVQDFVEADIATLAPHHTKNLTEDELRFLRPKEVAAILGISRQMLWRMRKAGMFIKPVKITDYCVGFRSDELLCWMNNRELVDNNE